MKKIRALTPPPPRKFSSPIVEDKAWNPVEEKAPEEEFEPETLVPGISKKTGRAKKRVSWPSAEKLEAVKLFTKEEGVIHPQNHL
jgi:hypothetical protein